MSDSTLIDRLAVAGREIVGLEAERDRLREALENLMIAIPGPGVTYAHERELLQERYTEARKALEAEG